MIVEFFHERNKAMNFSHMFNLDPGDLVINETMSNNNSIVLMKMEIMRDWIELYNTTNFPISTKGLYLTDTISYLHKWELPNT